MRRKQADRLTIALQMREAVGYLAALASRSDFETIALKLLGIHLDLGTKIDALTDRAPRPCGSDEPSQDREPDLVRH